MQRKKHKKRSRKNNPLVKAMMVGTVVFVFYILFVWDKKPDEENKKEIKNPEKLIEAIYKAPKFEMRKKKEVAKKEVKRAAQKVKPKKKQEIKAQGKKNIYHKVMPGDSLWKISKKYYGTGLKGDLIYQANRNKIANKNILPLGKRLLIPQVPSSQASQANVAKTEKSKKLQKLASVKTNQKREAPLSSHKYKLYKVQEDDSLSTISKDFYGTSRKWMYIWKANRKRIKNPNRLVVGMVLRIPMGIK